MMHETKARLLQKQRGKCRWCELHFQDGDIMEIDHIQPRSEGGTDRIDNKWLLHLHCHDERHARVAETERLRKQLAGTGINHP
jgi:RNA-directed DNA polymerase